MAMLPDRLDAVRPDLVIFDAEVDPHRDDRFGRLAPSDGGLLPREAPDALVNRHGPLTDRRPWRAKHQPSTCTVTLLTFWALGAVTVSRPSR